MLIGYFDYVIFAVLVFLNIKFWKTPLNSKSKGCLTGIFLGFVIPLISAIVEFNINGPKTEAEKKYFDAFTMTYVYIRFPMYWAILLVQMSLLAWKPKTRKLE